MYSVSCKWARDKQNPSRQANKMFGGYTNDKVIIITMKILCKKLIDRKANATPYCRRALGLPACAAGRVRLHERKSFIPWAYSELCKRACSWITLLPGMLSRTSSALPSATHCPLQACRAGVSFLFRAHKAGVWLTSSSPGHVANKYILKSGWNLR